MKWIKSCPCRYIGVFLFPAQLLPLLHLCKPVMVDFGNPKKKTEISKFTDTFFFSSFKCYERISICPELFNAIHLIITVSAALCCSSTQLANLSCDFSKYRDCFEVAHCQILCCTNLCKGQTKKQMPTGTIALKCSFINSTDSAQRSSRTLTIAAPKATVQVEN